jgi:hypothetical protein
MGGVHDLEVDLAPSRWGFARIENMCYGIV